MVSAQNHLPSFEEVISLHSVGSVQLSPNGKSVVFNVQTTDWMTYYVKTDIHPFTIQYLKATPWADESIYKLTSPITNINNAKTPTLIQHGEFDKRVPIAILMSCCRVYVTKMSRLN